MGNPLIGRPCVHAWIVHSGSMEFKMFIKISVQTENKKKLKSCFKVKLIIYYMKLVDKMSYF